MNNSTFLPINDSVFIEAVAKAIGRLRMINNTDLMIRSTSGVSVHDNPQMLKIIENEFEALWEMTDPNDPDLRVPFRDDAIAACNAINLQLLLNPRE